MRCYYMRRRRKLPVRWDQPRETLGVLSSGSTMSLFWLCFIAFVGITQGARRVPRQYFYNSDQAHIAQAENGRVQLQVGPASRAAHSLDNFAICRLVSSEGQRVSGDIVLRQTNIADPIEITGSISGLSPGYHGFHVHQNANLSDNCKAAGPHFNPENKSHGAPKDSERHAGDLGNIPVNDNGVSAFQLLDDQVSLFADDPRSIMGRAIVVHQKEDDLGRGGDAESKKTGNAGSRVACCLIEPAPRFWLNRGALF